MLIAIIAFGILAHGEAFQILRNNTDAIDGPSPVSALRDETEETTSYASYPPRGDEDPTLDIIFPLHKDIPNSSNDVSSVLISEMNATIFPKIDNFLFQEKDTSLLHQGNVAVFPKDTIPMTPEVSTGNPFSNEPNFGQILAGSVVRCYCQGNEVYVNGKCQVYEGDIVIPVQLGRRYKYTKEVNVMRYNVMVQDVNCDTSKHSYMNFTKNQFHIRPRGDVVLLKEAGKLEGQHINNYCISHHLDKHGDLNWTMKACVPIPSVPRCCPPGKAMKEGKCEIANTPDVLKPPISAKPFSDGIDWESITEFQNLVKCESEPLITIPLGHKQSTLVSLANSVSYCWVAGDTDCVNVYYICPDYCVDGINNSAGSVDYFTSFCYDKPIQTAEEACSKGLYLFIICNAISYTFLMITIVSHLFVPRLLDNGGLHRLCLLIGLLITYITRFSVLLFHNKITYCDSVNLVIAIQFGSLSTFSWLNVMCFETWRKIRRLKNCLPCMSYPNIYYMMYGWGLPFCICMITILMQNYAPENVWGVIKPYIGVSRCWFGEDIALLIYFYGPIVILIFFSLSFLVFAYINYKTMPQNYKETTKVSKVLEVGFISEKRNLPSIQINNHVQQFNQNLKMFLLLSVWNSIFWFTEEVLWLIHPLEQWALTDTLNSLQGFFIFIIIMSNSNKPKNLEKKKSDRLPANMKRGLQNTINRTPSQ